MKTRLLLVLTLIMSLVVVASAQMSGMSHKKGMSMKGMSHKMGTMRQGATHKKRAMRKRMTKKGAMHHGMMKKGMKMPMNHKM